MSATVEQRKRLPDAPASVWQRLTRPDITLTLEEDIQRSRLLANIALLLSAAAILAFSIIGVLRPGSLDDADALVAIAGVVGVLITYVLNRANKYHLAAPLFIVSSVIGTVFGPYLPAGSANMTAMSILPVLLTAFFYSTRAMLLVTGIVLTLHIALFNMNPFDTVPSIIGIIVTFVLDVVIFGYTLHQRGIERIRHSQLARANAALRESEAMLERRVEERTRALETAKEEAEAARARAEKADQVKSQFLASMSHELRTPMNAILNFTEMTSMGMLGPVNDQQQDALRKSLDSGKHLLTLINDVLDITKIQSGMMKLFLEDNVNLKPEIDAVIETAGTLLKSRPVELITDIDANLPSVRVDRRRVRQVLLNLVSNAAKFTETGSIIVRVKATGDALQFAVIDTGPGIEPEEQATILEPFQQTEIGIRHGGGTGLGLPISKYIVDAHGGRLWLESQTGQGTSFFFTLPLGS